MEPATPKAHNLLEIMFCCLIFLLAQSHASNATVKTLPGFPGELPFLLETGYIGVGNLDEVQLFYYFVQSEETPETDPLVLWLTGGPGCSALSALIYEIGPIGFDYKRSLEGHKPVLELKDYSWTKVANIIFLDAPVGTGFSYAKSSAAYNTSDTISAAHIYTFLRKWLLAHPRFQTNPVNIAGDGYSGITVPVVVQEISDGNEAGNIPIINLKGYILGNPSTDEKYDVNSRIKFAHRTGLLSNELYEETKLDCQGEYANPNKSDATCIEDLEIVNLCLKPINSPMILEPKCSTLNAKPDKIDLSSSHYGLSVSDALLLEVNPNPKEHYWCRTYDYEFINIWANDKQVQEALHVRHGTIQQWEMCNQNLSYVFDIKSSLDYHQNLTGSELSSIIYSGDHDLIIPYVGTQEWIQSLNLSVSSDEEWRPWFVDGQVGGYTETFRRAKFSITYATVKGGGHTAPEYRPKECLNMISRWFAHYFL